MSEKPIKICIDGHEVGALPGVTVAAAMLSSGADTFRTSVTGEPRAPLCGMGICFECRAMVDGVAHERTCLMLVREGMDIKTD